MDRCPHCQAELESPLVCASCSRLLEPGDAASPFELLGLAPEYALDRDGLEKRLLRLTRMVHPDFHATAGPEQRALAERDTARLNDAFEVLADDFRRADWLVKRAGGPSDADERQMPQEFLMEVLEWNEALEAAREGEADPASLGRLRAELDERRRDAFERIGAAFAAGSHDLVALRRLLNSVRYLDRALHELRELRLRAAR